MKNIFVLLILFVILAVGYSPVGAEGSTSTGAFETYAHNYWKARASAWEEMWAQVKKAAKADDLERAAKWGDIIHRWENPFHPITIIK